MGFRMKFTLLYNSTKIKLGIDANGDVPFDMDKTMQYSLIDPMSDVLVALGNFIFRISAQH